MINLRSKITKAILADLLLDPDRSYFINDLARRHQLDSGNLTRKLHELEREGLLISEYRGKERYYSANSKYPLFNEYKKIILKTVGVEAVLKNAFLNIPGLDRAFIYGSYAEDKMDHLSDIDIMVIGAHKLLDLQKSISLLQKKISREINLTSMTKSEYLSKKKSNNFVKSIEQKPRIELI